MIINITNRHDKVSPAVREKIEAQLHHSQERYDIISSAQVTLDKHERSDQVEIILHAAGRELAAKATGENLYAALDAAVAKADRQLAKLREKQTHKKGTVKHNALTPASDDSDMDYDEEENLVYSA
ncbi:MULTISPECIES: ribosome hibernation-promoting factor, HPF/YfiA family [Neptunomonas]|uniref:Ribosome-associated translation inhibitor RaiA n=1 Tax=Neptunomonas marina TaxID=1815562 RepID=A0A437Q4X4_9GAMM|nr:MULTISPECIES: ribosome-associated translation inhibitor RaiA [Neptunomonas]RVU29558.1 ribosome-associated translation inhibitor RaiA [Neptunomonas marina]